MKYYTPENPDWIEWIAPERFNDEELFRIVVFYVFHSPCKSLSAMGKSLSDYGWSAPWKKPYYLNKQLKQAASNHDLLFSVDNYEKFSDILESANLKEDFSSDLETERICSYNKKKNQFLSVFYHIRNAFSHGRLNMIDVDGECVFILEDVNTKAKNRYGQLAVSARMILKKSTLLKWIDIIEAGECEYNEN